MAFRAPHYRLNSSDQLATVERLGQEIVGAEPEAFDLVVELDKAREDQDRRAYARRAQAPQHFVPVDIGKHQIEENDVVIVKLTDLQTVLAEIGRIANEIFFAEHHPDAGSRVGIILDKKHAHKNLRIRPATCTGGALVNQDYRRR